MSRRPSAQYWHRTPLGEGRTSRVGPPQSKDELLNPSTKFSKVSHELLEALVRKRLGGESIRVWLCILRMTVGYHGKNYGDFIALSQLAKGTAMARRSLRRAVDDLVAKEMIIRRDDLKGVTHCKWYAIQPDYRLWVSRRAKSPDSGDR